MPYKHKVGGSNPSSTTIEMQDAAQEHGVFFFICKQKGPTTAKRSTEHLMKGTNQTKSDILEAFWRLYAQKPLDKITIRELTEVAGYNRGTFYLHYQDIYDLFESEKSRLLAEMEECVAYCSGNMGKIELIKLMMHVLALYERNRTQIVLLLGERGDPAFMKKLRGMMKQIPLWKAADPNLKASPGERDLLLEQNVAGVLFLIEAWLEDPRDVSPTGLLHLIYNTAIKR